MVPTTLYRYCPCSVFNTMDEKGFPASFILCKVVLFLNCFEMNLFNWTTTKLGGYGSFTVFVRTSAWQLGQALPNALIRSSKWFTIDWAMFVSYFLGESQLQLVCDSLKRKIWFSSAFLWEVCCKERKETWGVWWISYHANASNGLWILPEHWLPPHLLLKIYESALLQ